MYQGDLDDIEMYFMAAIKEIKRVVSGAITPKQEAMSKKAAEKNVHRIDQRAGCAQTNDYGRAVDGCNVDSVSHGREPTPGSTGTVMERLLGILQSAQGNAHEATNERLCALAQILFAALMLNRQQQVFYWQGGK